MRTERVASPWDSVSPATLRSVWGTLTHCPMIKGVLLLPESTVWLGCRQKMLYHYPITFG